jgi:hypothetical protein
VQKLISELRTENGKHRTEKQTAAQTAAAAEEKLAAVLKAAGLNPDGTTTDDPAAAAAELAERAEAAEARIWSLGTRSAIYDQAADAGVNAKLIFNSDEFRDTLDDLVDQDPETPAFRAAVMQKMRDYVAANPEYAGTKTPTGPRPDPGQGGRPTVVTDFATADKKSFDAELAKYKLRPRTY